MSRDLRPLDPVRSIKAKLGALVAAAVAVASLVAAVTTSAGAAPVLVVPVAVGVGLLVTQVLARGMTSPLREMTAAASRMADGHYGQRVRTDSRDEVGDLAVAFNRMAATLESVDQQRRDLVANVSHELRTPIAALHAVLENLADGVTAPDPDTLRAAHEQTERLTRLVSDLLDLSRVEEGIEPFSPVATDLGTLLREAVERHRDDRLEHVVAVEPAGLTVDVDPDRIDQLLANLLTNANRHSPPGGTVELRAVADDDVVVLTVSDEGPGIPVADRDRVFERFATSSARHSGTGLGLAIARWVAHLHGGTIVAAAPERGGASLVVTLPRHADTAVHPKEPLPMSTLTPPAPEPTGLGTSPTATGLLDRLWPDTEAGRPRLVAACAAVGTAAAIVLPEHALGVGWALVWAAACAIVVWARRCRPGTRRTSSTWSWPRRCSRCSPSATRSGSRCRAPWPPWRSSRSTRPAHARPSGRSSRSPRYRSPGCADCPGSGAP